MLAQNKASVNKIGDFDKSDPRAALPRSDGSVRLSMAAHIG
jgi:hypothetical protein